MTHTAIRSSHSLLSMAICWGWRIACPHAAKTEAFSNPSCTTSSMLAAHAGVTRLWAAPQRNAQQNSLVCAACSLYVVCALCVHLSMGAFGLVWGLLLAPPPVIPPILLGRSQNGFA